MQLLTDDRVVSGNPRRAPRRQTRRGSSGRSRRTLVLIGRVLLWSVVILLLARSGLGLVEDLRATPADQALSSPAATMEPSAGVEGFAARFAYDYLSYDAADPRPRAARLAAYIPRGSDDQFGWDGIGEQAVETVIPLGVQAVTADDMVVTVAALVSGNRWLQLLVPVHSDGNGRFAITAPPSYVAFLPPAAAVESAVAVDSELSGALRPMLESFFRAFAEGRAEDLTYFVPVGQSIHGLQGLVSLEELTDVRVGHGDAVRTAETVVRWRDQTTGAALVQRYQIGLVEQAGRWYVTSLGPAEASSQGGTP